MNAFKFKTLQNRLILALLLPVFGIMLIAGIFSFLYTRDAMLNQWNESAILKLQRAAHQIEMRLSKPMELIEMFYYTGSLENAQMSQQWILKRLESFDGIVRV
jgi:adenylate cyclase